VGTRAIAAHCHRRSKHAGRAVSRYPASAAGAVKRPARKSSRLRGDWNRERRAAPGWAALEQPPKKASQPCVLQGWLRSVVLSDQNLPNIHARVPIKLASRPNYLDFVSTRPRWPKIHFGTTKIRERRSVSLGCPKTSEWRRPS